MKLGRQWEERLRIWDEAFAPNLYHKLGALSLSGFTTWEAMNLDEVREQTCVPFPEGTAWGRKWEYGWFHTTVTVPPEGDGKRLMLHIGAGEEMLVFVNGAAAGSIDRAHLFVELTACGHPGERLDVWAEVYAGHGRRLEGGGIAPRGSVPDLEPPTFQQQIAESHFGIWNEEYFQAYADYHTLYELWKAMPESDLRTMEIGEALKRFTCVADFEAEEPEREESVRAAREVLAPLLQKRNGDTVPEFTIFGQSHLDLAWLWPYAETRRKSARTYANQLALMERYPDYRFLLCEPPLLEILKDSYPELYGRVKEKVRSGQMIPEGAIYVESDMNLAGGESLIRQFVLGKRWFQEELGVDSRLAWLPDTFGFCGALPQIMKGCDIPYFATQKLLRADPECEPFPYNIFWWEGIDGSRVLAHIFKRNNAVFTPGALRERWEKDRNQREDIHSFLFPFGYGDGGGGPTELMVETALCCEDLEGVPRCQMESPTAFFDRLKPDSVKNVYYGELYLRWHRGTYTAQAQIKKGVRKAEAALREAEYLAGLLRLTGGVWPEDLHLLPEPTGKLKYAGNVGNVDNAGNAGNAGNAENAGNAGNAGNADNTGNSGGQKSKEDQQALSEWKKRHVQDNQERGKESHTGVSEAEERVLEELDSLWKTLLFQEFHDILPGSSIQRVNEEAKDALDEVERKSRALARSLLQALAGGPACFNSLSWERTYRDVVLPPCGYRKVHTKADAGIDNKPGIGEAVRAGTGADDCKGGTISGDSFGAYAMPEPVKDTKSKFQVCSGISAEPEFEVSRRIKPGETLDFANAFYQLKADSLGRITSLVDRQTEYEYAAAPLNEWKLYQDVNICYDAWELGSMYESIPVELTGELFSTIQTEEDGSLILTVKRKERYFSVVQKIYLKKDSPRIDFVTEIDWHERHRILKADFPTTVFTKEVLEEIPFGYIRRPTHRSTGQEKDMYETCHHRYAVLTDGENGFALLNDCKYGLSAENSRLSLTLLRAPVQPDVTSDQGVHRFTYSILPFHGSFADSRVTEEAYELNTAVTECAEYGIGNLEVHDTEKNAEEKETDKKCVEKIRTAEEGEKVRKYGAGVTALGGDRVSYFHIEGSHVILETCKPAFDLENGVVLRLYESKGSAGIAMLQVPAAVKHIYSCNMLEHISEELELTAEYKVKLRFRAFEIKTLLLTV